MNQIFQGCQKKYCSNRKMKLSVTTTRTFTWILLIAAFISASLGGFSDILGRSLVISKFHAWMDASFLVLVAILLNVMV